MGRFHADVSPVLAWPCWFLGRRFQPEQSFDRHVHIHFLAFPQRNRRFRSDVEAGLAVFVPERKNIPAGTFFEWKSFSPAQPRGSSTTEDPDVGKQRGRVCSGAQGNRRSYREEVLMRVARCFRLHRLKGKNAERWSVRISGNWRLTFEFREGQAHVIDYEDCH